MVIVHHNTHDTFVTSKAHELTLQEDGSFLYRTAHLFFRDNGDHFQMNTGPTLISHQFARDTYEAFHNYGD